MQYKLKINNNCTSKSSCYCVSPSWHDTSFEVKNSMELLQFKQQTLEKIINLKVAENPLKCKIFDIETSCSQKSKLNMKNEEKTDCFQQSIVHGFSSSQESDFEGFPNEISVKHYEVFPQYTEEEEEKENLDIENSTSPGRLFIDEESSPSNCHLDDNNSRNKLSDISKLETLKSADLKILEFEKNNLDMNERSPDLFDLSDEIDMGITTKTTNIYSELNSKLSSTVQTKEINFDRELLKRIKNCLSGVPPPPSVTISEIDVLNAVVKNKENILNFYNSFKEFSSTNLNCQESCRNLFKPTHSLEEVQKMSWPAILKTRQHGLCYNISTVSEKIELLSMSVVERYVGIETSSSFHALSLNSKRSTRSSMKIQSPGARLSHLAKRRAAFSSVTLQSIFQKQIPKSISSRQILIDSKKSDAHNKFKVKTVKRETQGKTKTESSSSSAKKSYPEKELKPGPTRETSKRALFQSPAKITKTAAILKPMAIKPEIANRVEKSKRALFSPEKLDGKNEMKRKREDEDYTYGSNPNKIICSDFKNSTPRSLKFKSQSFCIGAGTSNSISLNNIKSKTLFRASSDTVCSSQLTESHRQKLLWAVSQALQTKHIGVDHPKFKQYATVLARAIKRLFLEFYLNAKCNSTSDTMLRLSKKYVHCALTNMTADDIYLSEKKKLEQGKQLSTRRIFHYIPPEDSENVQYHKLRKVPSAIFSENSYGSLNSLSQNCTQNSQYSEFSSQISQDSLLSKDNMNKGTFSSSGAIKLQNFDSIQASSLQNSSSKNNLHSVALRENVDCEQKKSGQKNFTGRDLKNTSPYIENMRSELKYRNVAANTKSSETNTVRVKRQISFDN